MHSETIEDSSNNHYEITNEGISVAADGKMGSALATGNNKYLTIPSAAFNLGLDSWTMEGWFYLTAYPSSFQGLTHTTIYYKGESGSDERISFSSATKIVIAQYYNSNQYSYTIDLTNEMPLNQWFHLAIVQEDTAIRAYIDGILSGTNSNFILSGAQIESSAIYLFNDGIDTVQSARGIQGKVDEFRLSNCARYSSNFDVADRYSLDCYVVSDDGAAYPNEDFAGGYYYKLLYSKA